MINEISKMAMENELEQTREEQMFTQYPNKKVEHVDISVEAESIDTKSSASQDVSMSAMIQVLLQLRRKNIDYNRSEQLISVTFSTTLNSTGDVVVQNWTLERCYC